ncbi:uncharacterized protein LOC127849293 [Dreissena polymorpha]|uniref:Mab-21-like HhH/H2TH-like domain-containing protein n=1 Tax=Dreissena polymorpha TaxID=45954 RepID=A0A9D4DT99_DREPO|nr:uncharacterized protein LOC127849293 [Dreissena polymorpha]KAH3755234.1 hypothetical protein DPMN_189924 [Dreissena polymorpha]
MNSSYHRPTAWKQQLRFLSGSTTALNEHTETFLPRAQAQNDNAPDDEFDMEYFAPTQRWKSLSSLSSYHGGERSRVPAIQQFLRWLYVKVTPRSRTGELEVMKNRMQMGTGCDVSQLPGLSLTGEILFLPVFSKHLSSVLDSLGYSKEMAEFRQDVLQSLTSTLFRDPRYVHVVIGSRNANDVFLGTADIDTLLVPKNIICTEKEGIITLPPDYTVVEMLTDKCTPGYTELRLARFGSKNLSDLRSCFVVDNGKIYVSSNLFRALQTRKNVKLTKERYLRSEILGIAVRPQKVVNYGLRCMCPDILKRWAQRRRAQNWPPNKTIQHVTRSEATLVVDSRINPSVQREWRICFFGAEQLLVRSLNDTQRKILVILQCFARTYFLPVTHRISSFVLQTIVFWMAEEIPQESFTSSTLLDHTLDALRRLRDAVIDNCLPHYIMPERNLFAGRTDILTGQNLCRVMTELLDKGPATFLLESVTIGPALRQLDVEAARKYQRLRDDLETACLKLLVFHHDPNLEDDVWDFTPPHARKHPDVRRLQKTVVAIVSPDCLKHPVSVCCSQRINAQLRWLLT